MIVRNLSAAVFLFVSAGAAGAQSLPKCDGTYATIRTSSILPGKMPLFEKAVADQAAWYAAHPNGSAAHLVRVLHTDPKTHAVAYSDDEAMTLTTHNKPGEPERDGAWAAFVAEFKASSKVKDEHRVCLPRM
ncbi:MAG: hypothetical protein JWO65_1853 [Sphingomonas bacterium]|jgi:hypothetical protein|nr:hypothetical protein [Sphingomonas bacterium]